MRIEEVLEVSRGPNRQPIIKESPAGFQSNCLSANRFAESLSTGARNAHLGTGSSRYPHKNWRKPVQKSRAKILPSVNNKTIVPIIVYIIVPGLIHSFSIDYMSGKQCKQYFY